MAADVSVTAYQLIVNKRAVPCVLDRYNFLLHISVMVLGDVSPRGRCHCIVITQHAETGLCPYAPGIPFLGHSLSWFNLFSPLCLPNICSFKKKPLDIFLSANDILFLTLTHSHLYRWGEWVPGNPGSTTRAAGRNTAFFGSLCHVHRALARSWAPAP